MRAWFTMRAGDGAAEIVIYDEIGKSFWGEETVSAKKFLDDLTALGDDVENITLRINSPGGDVFDGVAIHNALKNHKARVTAHVDGIAASIASYIAMAADKIIMPSNAFMLIHNASGLVMGNAEDMRATADDLDRIDTSILATYAARSGGNKAKIKNIMKEDRLMDAAEAKSLGLVDEVTKEVKMAATFSLRLLPKAAAERLRAETGADQVDPPPPPEPVGPAADASPSPPASTAPGIIQPFQPQGDPKEPKKEQQEPAPQPAAEPAPEPEPEPHKRRRKRHASADELRAYVAQVTDLCTLAGALDRVGHYVAEDMDLDDVRKDLLARRAQTQDVRPQHAMPGVAASTKPAPTWDQITSKINARLKA